MGVEHSSSLVKNKKKLKVSCFNSGLGLEIKKF